MLTWLEPWLVVWVELLREGSLIGILLTAAAGVALGLTPATYPFMPVVVGYAGEGKHTTRRRAAALSLAFVLGMSTVYTILGALFGVFGLALLTLLNRSIGLWYGILAPVLWILGLRSLGVIRFGIPLLGTPDPESPGRRGALGAYLLGLPFGLAGCPSCALILPSVLVSVAATGSPLMGASAMLALGLGQGVVLIAVGTYGGTLKSVRKLAPYRVFIERLLGVVLLLTAAYFTWRALLWL